MKVHTIFYNSYSITFSEFPTVFVKIYIVQIKNVYSLIYIFFRNIILTPVIAITSLMFVVSLFYAKKQTSRAA